MSGKILLITLLLVGIASQSSGRSLGKLSEKTFFSYGGSSGYGGGSGYTGTCDYWKSHPDAIVACIGSLGSIVGSFGDVCSTFYGYKKETLHDALCNTRTDCYGDLLREGAAAYLNSKATHKYAYSTQQVQDCIAVALTSKVAAVAQAAMFKKANYECHY